MIGLDIDANSDIKGKIVNGQCFLFFIFILNFDWQHELNLNLKVSIVRTFHFSIGLPGHCFLYWPFISKPCIKWLRIYYGGDLCYWNQNPLVFGGFNSLPSMHEEKWVTSTYPYQVCTMSLKTLSSDPRFERDYQTKNQWMGHNSQPLPYLDVEKWHGAQFFISITPSFKFL